MFKSWNKILSMLLHLTYISYLQSLQKKQTLSVVTHLKQSHNSALLTRNDWFLNRDVIDPYPGCKWKPPRHRPWQPAPVLLRRWEGTCGKMKAICLDGAMSSVCCVWCKQLHLSRYVKPWTVITRATPTETPSLHEAKLSNLWLICAQSSLFEDTTAYIFYALNVLRQQKFQRSVDSDSANYSGRVTCLTWSVCSVNNILY